MFFAQSEESEETLRVTKELQKRAEEKYQVLENKMKNAEAEREKELKAAQQKLNAAKAKADAFNKKLKQKQQVAPAGHLQNILTLFQQSIGVSGELFKCVFFLFSCILICRSMTLWPWS